MFIIIVRIGKMYRLLEGTLRKEGDLEIRVES